MKHSIIAVGAAIVTGLILPAAAQSLSKDVAARIEAIPIQTLTISDEQFWRHYWSVYRILIGIAEPIGRAPTIGRPWLWRLKDEHRK
jgi:hypothetical protein